MTAEEKAMTDLESEPVEISTVIGPGDWTEETLPQIVQSYRDRLIEMGAGQDSIITSIDRADNGSIKVSVNWDRRRIVPEVVEDAGRVGPEDSQRLRGVPLGRVGSPLVNEPSGSGSTQLSVPGPAGEKVIMYTDDDGTTWLEGRSDSED
ncbi:hypothetical protein [Arthrobacter livingstonensis]|uniref:hypothetical protein n=1 Tax=Arthrobacter livingstonensis TaxID=670078 RepID=UPI001B8847ED|nr:hypothetical protein [Arthrobacter livingstonensis]